MYIELHSRSAFSFLEGASVPEELASVCAQAGMPAMALLDRDGVYGAPRFHFAAKKLGVKAHIGAEITCAFSPQRHGDTEGRAIGNDKDIVILSEAKNPYILGASRDASTRLRLAQHDNRGGTFRLPLLAASRPGYQNLCRLISRMKMRGPKDAKPEVIAACEDDLRQYASGLICLTGNERGPLAQALAAGGLEEARRAVERLIDIFGRENVYVELERHFEREEEARNQAAVEIARALGLPLIATNGVRHATPPQRQILDVFTAIRNHKTLETAGRLLARNSERHLKPPAEMVRIFADLPEAIANTQELSSRLEFTLADLGYEFPRYPVPEGETMVTFLRSRTDEGARERYGRASPDLRIRARRQIERELALIEKLDLAGYFLIVWDMVCFCRQNGILVQGRGSAANSAVCYSLGITAVDPIGMDLLFERFLSEERGEWPDIDLDLPSGDQRERVIQYVYQRYGRLGAAMTANVITYRGRSAAREIGKALGFDAETLDRLSRLVGSWEYKDPNDTLERQFCEAGFDLRHPRLRKFFELSLAVQDLPRHLGQHSGGMVVCQGQLDSVVPLEPATMPDRVVVQWDKEDCADLGLIKVDLLGLGMMAVLEDSLKLIHDHYLEEVDLAHLPPDDLKVYAALQKADTVGMFQIESRAQMSCLPRLRPKSFYDIVVQVAIIRPGPIVGQMVNPYLKRRQGREPVTYPHPSLEPVLARTLGVPLFQEQLLRMAMIAAGFTGGEAEELRRAFGFKRSEARMRDIEVKLRAGMSRNAITPEAQEQIVQAITSFALYGFPESHAASFALLAYASAWLKCHYLAAFTAALLNNQPMGFYHSSTVVKDAQRHGLKIKPVDVMRSDWLCTLEPVASRQLSVVSESSWVAVQQSRNSMSSEGAIESSPARSAGLGAPSCASPVGTVEFALRLGLCYVKGLREEAARALVHERERAPFTSIDDLTRRVPELRKNELVTLAGIGALNSVSSFKFQVSDCCDSSEKLGTRNSKLDFHRRDALWHVERAARAPGELLAGITEADSFSPLERMSDEERLVADFRGTGLTVGPHPMAYRRRHMDLLGVRRAIDLEKIPNGRRVRVAGSVIARQRPGTAHGFVFLSLEDETGIANAIITPDLFEKNRLLLVSENFLLVEGMLQNLDNVISVKADRVLPLAISNAETSSHDFH
jgi:error-prone DNA polymerase